MVRSPIHVELWNATGSAEWKVCIALERGGSCIS